MCYNFNAASVRLGYSGLCIMTNTSTSSLIFKFSTLLNKSALKKGMAALAQNLVKNNIRSSASSTTEELNANEVAAPKLTKERANSLVLKLTDDERTTLLNTLQQFESDQLKADFKGQLAAFRWRTKLGRPSKVPRLGDVDPTGSYCPVPEDWLLKKYAETVPKPTGPQLVAVAIHNAVPFIGFGFLDNFLMIICGDYIELMFGTFMTISTMAAAALGNTMGDVLGLCCAGTVESLAAKVGVKAPQLAPVQLNMRPSRICANIGRGIGVTIGCLLGMTPLLFMNNKDDKDKDKEKGKESSAEVPAQ